MMLRRKSLQDAVKKAWPDLTNRQRGYFVNSFLNPRALAREFELATGLSNIARDYKMPLGRSKKQIETDFEIIRHNCLVC